MAEVEEIKDPESLDEIAAVKVSEELRSFVEDLDKEIEEAKTDRGTWEARQDIWQKKRHGIRAPKSFPWPGAANFVLPQIDSDINRLKPAYINLAFGVTPIVNFEPFGPEDIEPARKREALFDWRMKHGVKFFQPYCFGVDYALSRGFTLFKVGWKFETRKFTKILDLADLPKDTLEALFMPEMDEATLFNILAEETNANLGFEENVEELQRLVKDFFAGESKFEMTFTEKAENRAEVVALDPRDEVFFPTWVTNIQESPFIEHPFYSSKDTILRKMAEGRYEEYADSEIDTWRGRHKAYNQSQSIKNTRDGTTAKERDEDDILLKEVCGWYDVDGDGLLERVIMTYPEAQPKKILRFIEVPYDHGMFPYVVGRRELNDGPIISSRGIPALDDDFQTGMSTLFNQDIDAGTIATTPTPIWRKDSIKNLKNLRYVPGAGIETENGPADFGLIQQPNVGQPHRFASMSILKAWANDRIGNATSALSQSNNPGGQGMQGQKTAKEVSAIEAGTAQLQAMDLLVWQMQMADLYYMVDSLYEQFGDEEEYVSIMNEPPVKVTRAEQQGKFNIVPNGKLDNSNPVLRANKALSVMQVFGPSKAYPNGDPDINQIELKRWYLSEVDNKAVRRLMIPPQAKQAQQQQAKIAQNAEEGKAVRIHLGLKQAETLMEVQKEAMLARVQGKKYSTKD